MAKSTFRPLENRLLASLPPNEFRLVLPALEPVSFRWQEVLHEPGDRPDWVYFPGPGVVVSLLNGGDDHCGPEVGMVGNEGLVGLSVFLNGGLVRHRAVVQAPGQAWRMKSSDLVRYGGGGPFLESLHRLADALHWQATQIAECCLCHRLARRLCRWLATMRERLRSDVFLATHEGLAHALGVQRTGLTAACHALRKAGLIQYQRGEITITDADGLAAGACACHRRIGDGIDGLFR